jgi:peptide/nickel transport system substrate-binding protein
MELAQMTSSLPLRAALLMLFVLLVGCAGPAGDRRTGSAGEPGGAQRAGAPKRLTAAILGDLNTFSYLINVGVGSIRGVDEVEKLVHSGLTIVHGETGLMAPLLAENVPTLENGLWKVMPDGRMETTWRIREGARWHDGTPVTSADLVFTTAVGQDRDMAGISGPGYKSVDRVEAPDDRTILVTWSQPYIDADKMFSPEFAMPLPKHLLEPTFLEDRANFTQHPYFSQDFIGAGPFKVKEFVRSSHTVLAANPDYMLGRPKLDEIVVRFMSDPNTVIANILAGEVTLTLGRGLSLEQALQVTATWREGKMDTKPSNWIAHYPQHLTPNPAVIGNPVFRRALIHAMDRQGMSDAFQAGQATVAHTILVPTEPEFKDVEPQIVKYDYDPRVAAQLIDGLGYAKGGDGIYRDASGQRLSLEVRTNSGDDLKDKILFATADHWQRVGVAAETYIVPRQAASDRELRSTYPGFDLVRQPFEALRLHSSEAPLPTNRWAGSNRGRYMNPELDGLIDRYYQTIPPRERTQVLGQMLHHISEQAVVLGTFYGQEPNLIGNKLLNVSAARPPRAVETWNAKDWDLRS